MSPRTLSTQARQAMFSAQTGEALLVLLEIDHEALQEPFRLSSDNVDTVSGGLTYQSFFFRLTLADDRDDQISRARIEVDNVDRRIVEAVRSISGPPAVTVRLVLASTPDVLEAGPIPFQLLNANWDALIVEGELGYDLEIINQAYPAHRMTPQFFPGLFS